MSIYSKRIALPSPGRDWAGADRPQPFSTRFASVHRFCVVQSLGGPRMQVWGPRAWSWLVSARQRWPLFILILFFSSLFPILGRNIQQGILKKRAHHRKHLVLYFCTVLCKTGDDFTAHYYVKLEYHRCLIVKLHLHSMVPNPLILNVHYNTSEQTYL